MKATYKTKSGISGMMDYPAIIPQPMQHTDGFTLLGFESWEHVTDEKPCAAATNVEEFIFTKEKMGFASVEEQN